MKKGYSIPNYSGFYIIIISFRFMSVISSNQILFMIHDLIFLNMLIVLEVLVETIQYIQQVSAAYSIQINYIKFCGYDNFELLTSCMSHVSHIYIRQYTDLLMPLIMSSYKLCGLNMSNIWWSKMSFFMLCISFDVMLCQIKSYSFMNHQTIFKFYLPYNFIMFIVCLFIVFNVHLYVTFYII